MSFSAPPKAPTSAKKCSFVGTLHSREIGQRRPIRSLFTPNIEKRINSNANDVLADCNALKEAIAAGRIENVETVLGDILGHFLHQSGDDNDSDEVFNRKQVKKRQQRELFMSLGGAQSLMKLFLPPFAPSDARTWSARAMKEKTEMLTELLVIVRELISSVPFAAETLLSDQHIVFLFTMLSHSSVFENTMSILEEVLATREDTFNLASIPRFFSLVNSFSPRHLAHFCRVLSLVVFEPEDRFIMEGSHVLRSLELLQLRRNRISKNCLGAVERNQNLVFEMPNLLSRLVQILRVVNHGPGLSDLVSHNIVTHMPITSDVLEFYSTKYGIDEWDHFSNLEIVAERSPPAESDNIHPDLLNCFAPIENDEASANTHHRAAEFAHIVNVMNLARSLGLADATPLGHAVEMASLSMSPNNSRISMGLTMMQRLAENPQTRPSRSDLTVQHMSPSRARKELQFQAMVLTPHQIELVFVICTLLSGRRKLAVQRALIALRFGGVLDKMYDRMSWDAPPYEGPSHMEHMHGPNCECNPEGAVRIQFLRLIHNFYDRDFLGNENKFDALSAAEQRFVSLPPSLSPFRERDGSTEGEDEESESDSEAVRALKRRRREERLALQQSLVSQQGGLIVKIIRTMRKEKPDSTYRFWLSACVENFLRGSGRQAQLLAAQAGVLLPTVQHIVHCKTHSTLQTSFDLLGEVVKGHAPLLRRLEEELSNDEFRELMHVIMDNLVESNVFLRSLVLTLEIASVTSKSEREREKDKDKKTQREEITPDSFGFVHSAIHVSTERDISLTHTGPGLTRRFAYLHDTWAQFSPRPLLRDAVDQFDAATDVAQRVEEKLGRRVSLKSIVGGIFKAMESGTASLSKAIWDADLLPEMDLDLDEGYFTPDEDEYEKTVTAAANTAATTAATAATTAATAGETSATTHNTTEYVPVTPQFNKSKLALQNAMKTTTKQSGGTPINSPGGAAAAGNTPSTGASAFGIPNSLFRFSMFMLQEKVSILVRLMSIVSLRNVNHENICCLNTALLIMLFDYTRGTLSSTLQKIRQFADQELSTADATQTRKRLFQNLRKDTSDVCCIGCSAPATTVSSNTDGELLCGVCLTPSAVDEDMDVNAKPAPHEILLSFSNRPKTTKSSGGDILMKNFRELLWYWQEYYLRRGRDRLSIEFSCHIPFRYWLELVGVLCADDGSSTSLLSEPMFLPRSPYIVPVSQLLQFNRLPQSGVVQSV